MSWAAWRARRFTGPAGSNADYVDYLHRERTLLVRDADVDRVTRHVSAAPVAHDSNVRGLTRLAFTADERRGVEETCAHIDRALGEGVVTPDHILYICPISGCPATEPEKIAADAAPDPGMSGEASDGDGVLMVIPDSGLLPGAAEEHTWLAGVDGREGEPDRRLPASHSSVRGARDLRGRRRAGHGA